MWSLILPCIVAFLSAHERGSVQQTCRSWRSLLRTMSAEPEQRTPTAEETEHIVAHLKRLRLPWSSVTENQCFH
jgi:hypothetical protein